MKDRAEKLGLLYPRTYWHGEDLRDLVDADLPAEWVLKPNHRSGLVYFGSEKPDIPELERVTAGWLEEWQGARLGEWAYTMARRMLIVEEQVSAAATITDYKLRVFHGKVVACAVIANRFSNNTTLTFYSPTWDMLPITQAYPRGEWVAPPANLEELVGAAELMAAGLDFMRVDFYTVGDKVYFGEVTPYPASGLVPIRPYSADLAWGNLWQLPRLV